MNTICCDLSFSPTLEIGNVLSESPWWCLKGFLLLMVHPSGIKGLRWNGNTNLEGPRLDMQVLKTLDKTVSMASVCTIWRACKGKYHGLPISSYVNDKNCVIQPNPSYLWNSVYCVVLSQNGVTHILCGCSFQPDVLHLQQDLLHGTHWVSKTHPRENETKTTN